jgi:hypothetical protein
MSQDTPSLIAKKELLALPPAKDTMPTQNEIMEALYTQLRSQRQAAAMKTEVAMMATDTMPSKEPNALVQATTEVKTKTEANSNTDETYYGSSIQEPTAEASTDKVSVADLIVQNNQAIAENNQKGQEIKSNLAQIQSQLSQAQEINKTQPQQAEAVQTPEVGKAETKKFGANMLKWLKNPKAQWSQLSNKEKVVFCAKAGTLIYAGLLVSPALMTAMGVHTGGLFTYGVASKLLLMGGAGLNTTALATAAQYITATAGGIGFIAGNRVIDKVSSIFGGKGEIQVGIQEAIDETPATTPESPIDIQSLLNESADTSRHISEETQTEPEINAPAFTLEQAIDSLKDVKIGGTIQLNGKNGSVFEYKLVKEPSGTKYFELQDKTTQMKGRDIDQSNSVDLPFDFVAQLISEGTYTVSQSIVHPAERAPNPTSTILAPLEQTIAPSQGLTSKQQRDILGQIDQPGKLSKRETQAGAMVKASNTASDLVPTNSDISSQLTHDATGEDMRNANTVFIYTDQTGTAQSKTLTRQEIVALREAGVILKVAGPKEVKALNQDIINEKTLSGTPDRPMMESSEAKLSAKASELFDSAKPLSEIQVTSKDGSIKTWTMREPNPGRKTLEIRGTMDIMTRAELVKKIQSGEITGFEPVASQPQPIALKPEIGTPATTNNDEPLLPVEVQTTPPSTEVIAEPNPEVQTVDSAKDITSYQISTEGASTDALDFNIEGLERNLSSLRELFNDEYFDVMGISANLEDILDLFDSARSQHDIDYGRASLVKVQDFLKEVIQLTDKLNFADQKVDPVLLGAITYFKSIEFNGLKMDVDKIMELGVLEDAGIENIRNSRLLISLHDQFKIMSNKFTLVRERLLVSETKNQQL